MKRKKYADGDFELATFNPYIFQPIVYNPKPYDYKHMGDAALLAERRQANATEAYAALDNAFGTYATNLNQDPETLSWFENLKNGYKERLNALMNAGDYSRVTNEAVKMAGEAANNPELIARLKTSKQYEAHKKAVNDAFAKGDFDQTTRDRWLEQNQYSFKPIVDDNGKVIGGGDYTPSWMPVKQQDLSIAYSKLMSLVGTDKATGSKSVFLDKNGNPTTDPSKNYYGLYYKTNYGYERVSAQKLKDAWDALSKDMPEVYASLKQDYDNAVWKYSKLDDKESWGSEIADEQGNHYTESEYVANRVSPMLDKMAYNHTNNSTEVGDANQAYARAQYNLAMTRSEWVSPTAAQLLALQREGLGGAEESLGISTRHGGGSKTLHRMINKDIYPGLAIEQVLHTSILPTYGKVNRAVTTILNLSQKMGNFKDGNKDSGRSIYNWITNGDKAKEYFNAGNYQQWISLVGKHLDYYRNRLPEKYRKELRGAIRELEAEGNRWNNYRNKLPKEAKESLDILAAIQNGVDIQDIKNNTLASAYVNNNNALFFNVSSEGRFKFSNYDNYAIKLTNRDLETFLNRNKLTETTLNAMGIDIVTDKNGQYLRVNKNTSAPNYLARALDNAFGAQFVGFTQGNFENGKFYRMNRESPAINALSNLNKFRNNLIYRINTSLENDESIKGVANVITIPFSSLEARAMSNAQVASGDVKEQTTLDTETYASAIHSAPQNYTFYKRETGSKNDAAITKQLDYNSVDVDKIVSAMMSGKAKVSLAFSPLTGETGIQVTTSTPKETYKTAENTYVIFGVDNGKLSNYIRNNEALQTRMNAARDKAIGTYVKGVDGHFINPKSSDYDNEYFLTVSVNSICRDLENSTNTYGDTDFRYFAAQTLADSGFTQDNPKYDYYLNATINKLKNSYDKSR